MTRLLSSNTRLSLIITSLFFALVGTVFGIYATVASTQKQSQVAQYVLTFNVALSTHVYPVTGSTTLQLYQQFPLYSTIQQPLQYTNVLYTIANYEIYDLTPEGYAVTLIAGTTVFGDGSSLVIGGSVVRDVKIDSSGKIISNRLISTDISILGGTGLYKGAYGIWKSTQTLPFVTTITATLNVPIWNS